MDRRLLLAIAMMLVVLMLPQVIFPAPPPIVPDSAVTVAAPVAEPTAPPSVAPAPAPQVAAAAPSPTVETVPARTVVVRSADYQYDFSTTGARLIQATFPAYRDLSRDGDVPAQLLPDSSDFLRYRLVAGRDTLALDSWSFTPSADTVDVGPDGATLSWLAVQGPVRVEITYRFHPEQYLFSASGLVTGAGRELLMLVDLGPRLRSVDGDTTADIQSYGVVTKAGGTDRTSFRSLDPGERRALVGPFEWVAIKSKYFVAALMTIELGQPRLGGAVVTGGQRTGRLATELATRVGLPAPGGAFAFSFYAGPQEYRRLTRIGHAFEDVNPYGWVLRPIIRPIANFIVRIMLWTHETLSLSYGLVLILFGLVVRMLLWPLYGKSMKASMAMQAIQPEMKSIQERYKQDPQKLQQEMIKLYKEHKVNPVAGCLPMMLPMPILFALFFVFANTIEFRGVPFLWIPDLSRADPLYIIPVLMGASMFLVSKIAQRGMPDNPQAKMMMYLMPPILTVLFLQFSAGLNVYYAVSNVAGIPQQWLVSQERLRRAGALKKS
jgi:YidC/Oxa1 family membrane protein insertase